MQYPDAGLALAEGQEPGIVPAAGQAAWPAAGQAAASGRTGRTCAVEVEQVGQPA
jgi:hypothetical protein